MRFPSGSRRFVKVDIGSRGSVRIRNDYLGSVGMVHGSLGFVEAGTGFPALVEASNDLYELSEAGRRDDFDYVRIGSDCFDWISEAVYCYPSEGVDGRLAGSVEARVFPASWVRGAF